MEQRDLTPEEARAEVEAFLGEKWHCDAGVHSDGELFVVASRGWCDLYGADTTYRAAVSALKSAWRDAVRPWVAAAVDESRETVEVHGDAYWKWPETREEAVSRVLKEDDK